MNNEKFLNLVNLVSDDIQLKKNILKITNNNENAFIFYEDYNKTYSYKPIITTYKSDIDKMLIIHKDVKNMEQLDAYLLGINVNYTQDYKQERNNGTK